MIDKILHRNLFAHLRDYYPVSKELEIAMRPLLTLRHYTHNQTLCKAGNSPKYLWCILDGFVRYLKTKNEKETTRICWFAYSGSITLGSNPFNSRVNPFDIEVLKGSTLIFMKIDELLHLSIRFPEIKLLASEIEDNNIAYNFLEFWFRMCGNKKKYYGEFKIDHPDLFEVCPHDEILRYLYINGEDYL